MKLSKPFNSSQLLKKTQGGASLEFIITGKFRLEGIFIHFCDIRNILGYPHPLPTLFITSLNSLTNPWSFGFPFSLGHCHGDFGFSREIWIFQKRFWLLWLHFAPAGRWILIRPASGNYLSSSLLWKFKLLGGAWEEPPENTWVWVTLPTSHFWEVNGIQPNIPSEFTFLNQILAFLRYLERVPHNHWKFGFGELLPFCFVSNVSLNLFFFLV